MQKYSHHKLNYEEVVLGLTKLFSVSDLLCLWHKQGVKSVILMWKAILHSTQTHKHLWYEINLVAICSFTVKAKTSPKRLHSQVVHCCDLK